MRKTGERPICRPLEVVVGDQPVEKAVRAFRNKVAREGILKELKRRRFYEKPSAVRKRKMREAERRRRRTARRIMRRKKD
jgi:small subunit ribosomal protein S21